MILLGTSSNGKENKTGTDASATGQLPMPSSRGPGALSPTLTLHGAPAGFQTLVKPCPEQLRSALFIHSTAQRSAARPSAPWEVLRQLFGKAEIQATLQRAISPVGLSSQRWAPAWERPRSAMPLEGSGGGRAAAAAEPCLPGPDWPAAAPPQRSSPAQQPWHQDAS